MSLFLYSILLVEQLLLYVVFMIFIDCVVVVSEDQLQVELEICFESLFYNGIGVGVWVGIEYMVQSIVVWVGYQEWIKGGYVKIGFLLGVCCYGCSVLEFVIGMWLGVLVQLLLQVENGLGFFECCFIDLVI